MLRARRARPAGCCARSGPGRRSLAAGLIRRCLYAGQDGPRGEAGTKCRLGI